MVNRPEWLRAAYRAANVAFIGPLWFAAYTLPAVLLCTVILWCYSGEFPYLFIFSSDDIITSTLNGLKGVHVAHIVSETIATTFVIMVGMYYFEQYLSVIVKLMAGNPYLCGGAAYAVREPRTEIRKVISYLWFYVLFFIISYGVSDNNHTGVEFIKSTFVATGIGVWMTAGFGGLLLRKFCEPIANEAQS